MITIYVVIVFTMIINMTKVVYKLALPNDHIPSSHSLRQGVLFLHVDYQQDEPYLWYEIDLKQNTNIEVEFRKIGTGWDIEPEWFYIGTLMDAPFVWHFYARYIND